MGLEVFHTFTALFKKKCLFLCHGTVHFGIWVNGGQGGVYQKNFFNTPLPLFIINSLQRDCYFHFIMI